MSTLVEAFSIQLKNENIRSRKKAIQKKLESKDVSELLRDMEKDNLRNNIFSLKDSRSNIGKYIELLKIIAEFATEHVNYELINKDRHSGNDETHEKWNNVMTQSYMALKHAEDNKHNAELNNRLLGEEWMNDDEKMRELNELHESMKKGESPSVVSGRYTGEDTSSTPTRRHSRGSSGSGTASTPAHRGSMQRGKKTVPKKKKTVVKKKSKMRKKTAKKYRK
jgi:hypothetical protein